MRSLSALLFLSGVVACLDTVAPRRAPSPLRLVTVEAARGALDALPRAPTLRLRFDRPLRAPSDDPVALLRGEGSASLLGDFENPPLSASALARRLDARISIDPDDPAALVVSLQRALAPDAAITLLLSTRVESELGVSLDRARWEPLRVAPVTRCGAVPRAVFPSELRGPPRALAVRFDRGVRGEVALSLASTSAAELPVDARLDCFDAEGYARCAWITPRAPLPVDDYVIRPGELTTRSGSRCERVELALRVLPGERSAPPAFARPLPCAADERALSGVCARVGARSITLRAATQGAAFLRARATPDDQDDPREAVGSWGSSHAIRIEGLRPSRRHALTLWAHDGVSEPAYLPLGAIETVAAQGDLRITEVLSRPRGAASQEFVEVENLGDEPTSMRGWTLRSASGASEIEADVVLPPRGRALIVGASFDLRGSPREGDPAALPGAAVIALRAAIASRGLRDQGADLSLLDPSGVEVSVFPGAAPELAPRAGVSIVRAGWDLDEDDPAAWSWDTGDDSTPGGANRVAR